MRDIDGYIDYLFKFRLRTKAELIERLKRKGFPEEEIKKKIEELEEEGIIDDERFARIYVREKVERECIGKNLLIDKLLRKGIKFEMAKKIVFEEYDTEKIISNCRELYLKLKRKEKEEKKIIEYFKRRGIGFDILKKIKNMGLESQ